MLSVIDPRVYSQAFLEGGALLGRHSRLILGMAARELRRSHTGQMMGVIWIVLHPLFLTLVYVFIFGVVFRQRMGGTFELPLDYTTYILSGLIPWFSFYGAMTASCNSIIANTNLVKQFVFHLEVLPAKDVAMALVVWLVGVACILVYTLLVERAALLTWLLLPLILGLQVTCMLGVAFILSAVTVFLRDLRDVVQLFGTINIFLMPVVYLPSAVPGVFRPVIYLNPLSHMIWVYRDVLYFGRVDHPWSWAIFGLGSVLVFALGYKLFRRLKPHFGNVL